MVLGARSPFLSSAAAVPASSTPRPLGGEPGSLDQAPVGQKQEQQGKAGAGLRPEFAETDIYLALFSFAFQLRREKASVFMTPACDSIFCLNSG